jgi:hypothetical protein
MSCPALALLLLLASTPVPPQTAPASRPAPPRPGLSWEDADALARKIEEMDRRFHSGQPGPARTVPVTEPEINSYLNLSVKMPPGLSNLEVRLESERVAAKGLLDLDRVQGRPSGFGPLSLLSGVVGVELRARLASQDGLGALEVEEARLGALPIPVSLLEQLVVSFTRTPEKPQGFDIRAPFRLPYAVKRVRLQPGRALLDF